jgi:hypothetical protein
LFFYRRREKSMNVEQGFKNSAVLLQHMQRKLLDELRPEQLRALSQILVHQWRKEAQEAQRVAQDWESHQDHLQRENDRLRSLIRRNPVLRLARAFRRLKGQLGLGPK